MTLAKVTAAIAAAAATLNDPAPSLEATLETIAFAARESVPGFDLAGISTVDHQGNVETRAVTDPRVLEFDKLQYSLGEGPCLDALGAAHVVSVPRLRHEQRWPHYVPRVLGLGLRSQLAVKISLDDTGTLGGINLYSTTSDDIDPEAESIAELFAVHAAIAMGSVIKIGQLSTAMQTRKVIGQAIGIVMERYGIPEDNAFHFLVRASQKDNIKLRDIAAGIVDESNRRYDARSLPAPSQKTAPPSQAEPLLGSPDRLFEPTTLATTSAHGPRRNCPHRTPAGRHEPADPESEALRERPLIRLSPQACAVASVLGVWTTTAEDWRGRFPR
jgi:hypothetical protein